jgi:hypothetical protein
LPLVRRHSACRSIDGNSHSVAVHCLRCDQLVLCDVCTLHGLALRALCSRSRRACHAGQVVRGETRQPGCSSGSSARLWAICACARAMIVGRPRRRGGGGGGSSAACSAAAPRAGHQARAADGMRLMILPRRMSAAVLSLTIGARNRSWRR